MTHYQKISKETSADKLSGQKDSQTLVETAGTFYIHAYLHEPWFTKNHTYMHSDFV